MKLKNVLISAVFLAASATGAIPIAWAADSAPVLKQIIAGLATQQKAARNLRVTVVTHFSSLNKDRKGLHNIGLTRISAIFTNGGRFRMRVHSVSGGYNILAPAGLHLSSRFMAMDYLAAYNGRVGTFYNIKAGYIGKVSPSQAGRVSGGPPKVALSYLRWTGRAYSTWGISQNLDWAATASLPQYQEAGLLEFLENPPPNARISANFSHARAGHSEAILTVIWLSKDIIELDPKRNFSILRDERYFAKRPPRKPGGQVLWDSRPGNTFTVTGFWNPAPGVYYPKYIVDDFFDRRLEPIAPVTQNVLSITNVRVNDPKIDASTFVVHFPIGTQITDESTGQVIHVAGTPRQQAQAIGKAVQVVRKMIAKPPAAKGGEK